MSRSEKCYLCGRDARHEAYQPDYDKEGNYNDWDYRPMCCYCYNGSNNNENCDTECPRGVEVKNA